MALTRSEQMSRISGASTQPEVVLRDALVRGGVGVEPQRTVEGVRVDLAIGERVLVLVDGCFWHGCPRHYVMPRSNADFWAEKLRVNVARDSAQTAQLLRAGYVVVRVWEHDVFERLDELVSELRARPVVTAVNSPRVGSVEPVDDERRRTERRLLVDLANPAVIVDVSTGPRVTAKWRRPPADRR